MPIAGVATGRLIRRGTLRLTRLVKRRARLLALAAIMTVAALTFVALHLALRDVHLPQLRQAIATVPAWQIAAALGLTFASYVALTFYDRLALQVIGRPQPWRISALASFTGQAVGYSLGLPLLTAGSARFRVYGQVGLSIGEVAQVGLLGTAAFWSGVAGIAGGAMLMGVPLPAIGGWALTGVVSRALGAALLLLAVAPLLMQAVGRRQVGVGHLTLPLPGGWRMAGFAVAAAADLATASGALFVLLPVQPAGSYPGFFLVYVLAIVVALITHVPGGIGVFEAVILAAQPGSRAAVFAALLLYRLIYYLLPLLAAAAAIAVGEARRLHRPIAAKFGPIDQIGQALAPGAVTLLVFMSGLVLLVSGALPGVEHRMSDLDALLPLPFIEGSHLGGSLVGTALLLVAPALNARLRNGLLVARPLLLAGALFSLAKGLDYEEAAIQLGALAVLHYARASFYRRGSLTTAPLDARWLAAAAAALGLSIWAGLFAYKHVPYADELWWEFALRSDAPRFLRASFAGGILLACVAGWQLLGGRDLAAASEVLPPDVAARALAVAPRTDANLAFTGDKRFIIAAAGDAFLMYRVQGRTWVVMGDPVGSAAAWPELIWRIRQLCDTALARLVLYQISAAMLPMTVDLGMDVMKYGEEAHVDLAGFTLAGPRGKDWRNALRRADAAGLSFGVIAPEQVPAIMPQLRAVSEAWLAGKSGSDKRFSLGPFDPAYLERFPCAVVRDGERVIAFANIWVSTAGGEISVDLMRHLPDAPPGTMDMLFARLLLWGQVQGHGWFNLGVAPLTGLPDSRLAPLWAKIGRTIFARGERLYGFAGLRAFKAKFQPNWQPRYIATPRGLSRMPSLLGLLRVVNS